MAELPADVGKQRGSWPTSGVHGKYDFLIRFGGDPSNLGKLHFTNRKGISQEGSAMLSINKADCDITRAAALRLPLSSKQRLLEPLLARSHQQILRLLENG